VLGLAGVVALMGIDVAGRSSELLGAAAILAAAFCYANGSLMLKLRFGELDPRATMGVSLGIAAVLLTPAAAIAPPESTPSGDALLAIFVLGLFCTAAALVFFGVLVSEAGPSRALVITYVSPVVAVALGVTILGEDLGAGAIAGLLLILAGSWLSTGGRLPPGLGAVAARARGVRGASPSTRPDGAASQTRRSRSLRRRGVLAGPGRGTARWG
jgi:drug/metabolite transporter (DMT)-like permease